MPTPHHELPIRANAEPRGRGFRRRVGRGLAILALTVCTPLTQAASQLPWQGPSERLRGWQADLDLAVSDFLARDRSFSPEARARFKAEIQTLRASIASLTDEQLIVKLAQEVAGARNAHTRLYLLRNRTALRRYPIRVWWFRNDLAIIRAHPEHAGLLGGRILTLAGQPVTSVARAVESVYAGNQSWKRYMSAYLLTSPEILKGTGVLGGDELPILVETPDGRRRTVRMSPMPLERSDLPLEAWWDLSPTHPGRQGPWLSALPSDESRLPLAFRHLDRFYWAERIPAARAVYLQYNRAQDQPGRETVAEFGTAFLQDLERAPFEKLVIDLRFNTGGNLELADPFFRRLAALPLAQQRGRMFVITGRATFSAGLTPVALLKQLTRVVIAGEPAGDVLDFWSEGGNLLLPNTRLTLHFADGFHSYSPIEHPEFRPYNYDLSVSSVAPDLLVEQTLGEFLAGKDPALDAVLKR